MPWLADPVVRTCTAIGADRSHGAGEATRERGALSLFRAEAGGFDVTHRLKVSDWVDFGEPCELEQSYSYHKPGM